MPKELIETLWNVNISDLFLLLQLVYELIETLWNVNSERFILIDGFISN